MHISELASRTGVTARQIRYLIAEGFAPAPRGGRATADYGEDHVAAVRRYGRLRELGFPPAAIRLLLEAKSGAPFPVAPGLTLVVDPDLIGSGAAAGPILDDLRLLLEDIFRETRDADAEPSRDD